jgi:hypothetical protein
MIPFCFVLFSLEGSMLYPLFYSWVANASLATSGADRPVAVVELSVVALVAPRCAEREMLTRQVGMA